MAWKKTLVGLSCIFIMLAKKLLFVESLEMVLVFANHIFIFNTSHEGSNILNCASNFGIRCKQIFVQLLGDFHQRVSNNM